MGKQAGVRQEAMLKDLHRDGAYRRFEANVTGRLLVDYGQATATEVAISFHRMWGVPRIPGSALKGASRAYALLGGEWLHDTIETYFGSDPGTQPLKLGCITFYDALPVDGSFELAMDVLTPHHQEYYQGKQAPVEWEDPIPFTFLSVVKTRFVFSVGVFPQPGEKRNASERIERAEMAGKLLKETLELGGVGAKTSAGYGYFSGFADR